MPVKVLLVDNHDMIRSGIRSLLEASDKIGPVAEASDGLEAIMKARQFSPDVVVMNCQMPKAKGVNCMREITRQQPQARVLLLSMNHNRDAIIEGIAAGARGFLNHKAQLPELIEAICTIAQGNTWYKGEVAELIAPYLLRSMHDGKALPRQPNKSLSPREREIVGLIAMGENIASIALLLGICKHTVEIHKTNINKKLNTRSISDITKYAIREHIVTR